MLSTNSFTRFCQQFFLVEDEEELSRKVSERGFDRNSPVVPPVVEDTITYLEQNCLDLEGIFRISGSVEVVKGLRADIEQGKAVDFTTVDPHAVAGVLKQFFREMPDPLLTYEYFDCFLAAMSVDEIPVRSTLVQNLLLLLPPGNKSILTRLILFLKKVHQREQVNKMTAGNLAIVFGPTLLRSEGDMSVEDILNSSKVGNQLVEFLLDKANDLFPIGKKSQSTQEQADQKKLLSVTRPEFYSNLKRGTVRLATNLIEEKIVVATDLSKRVHSLPTASFSSTTTPSASELPPPPLSTSGSSDSIGWNKARSSYPARTQHTSASASASTPAEDLSASSPLPSENSVVLRQLDGKAPPARPNSLPPARTSSIPPERPHVPPPTRQPSLPNIAPPAYPSTPPPGVPSTPPPGAPATPPPGVPATPPPTPAKPPPLRAPPTNPGEATAPLPTPTPAPTPAPAPPTSASPTPPSPSPTSSLPFGFAFPGISPRGQAAPPPKFGTTDNKRVRDQLKKQLRASIKFPQGATGTMAFNTPSIYSKLLTSPKKPDDPKDKASNELQMKLSKQLADELAKKGGGGGTLKSSPAGTPSGSAIGSGSGSGSSGSGIKPPQKPVPVPPKRSTSPSPASMNPNSPRGGETAEGDEMLSPRDGESEPISVERLITTLIGDWDISTLGDGKEEIEDDLKMLLLRKLGD